MVKSMCDKFHAKIIIFPGIMEGGGGHNAPPPIRGEPPKSLSLIELRYSKQMITVTFLVVKMAEKAVCRSVFHGTVF